MSDNFILIYIIDTSIYQSNIYKYKKSTSNSEICIKYTTYNQFLSLQERRELMGIDGLLKFLAPITEKQHISSFKNQRIGVDLMPWIYRGCYSCNFELSQNIESIRYLYYPLEMIQILSYYNIKPIFVLDGRSINMKDETNQKRRRQKQQNKQKGLKYLKQGKLQEARKYLSRCIFIDEKIISKTIDVLFSKNIQFIVAPYEADCQIAKLRKLGLIDAAISQDSDLITYGVNTILKLNQNGDCDYIDVNKWKPRDVDNEFLKQYLALDMGNKIDAAILTGTDYNTSVKGIGIKRAVRLIYKQTSLYQAVQRLKNQAVYADKIPQNYLQLTQKVKMVFLFAKVYNPITKQLQFLNPDLIDEFMPKQMTLEMLNKIVGEDYSEYYDKQVYNGKTIAKTLQTRNIKAVNIREMFVVNKQNMLLHQTYTKQRKQQSQIIKQQREYEISQGLIRDDSERYLPNNRNKPEPPKPKPTAELTEQQKQKRKQQRKNRIVKLHQVMNSVVEMCEQQSRQQQEQKLHKKSGQNQFIQETHLKLKQMLNQIHDKGNKKQKNSCSSDENDSQCMDQQSSNQSMQMDLAHLNPFAKVLQKTALKQSSTQIKK